MLAQSKVVEETLKEFFTRLSPREEPWKLRSNCVLVYSKSIKVSKNV
jgi:hypothetical protein